MASHRPILLCVVLGAFALSAASGSSTLQAQEAPTLPSLVLEDFESATTGARPYLWKEFKRTAQEATVGAEPYNLDGDEGNKALKFAYSFSAAFDPAHGVECGPGSQALPGGLTALDLAVHGDNSRNLLAVRIKDRNGETFEWRMPVTWMGWKTVSLAANPATAIRSTGSRSDGKLDPPLALDVVRIARSNGGLRKGEVMIDNLTARIKHGKVALLYDCADGVKPELWRANRNRATIGLLAESLVRRDGKDLPALKMEYEYEAGEDSSVEYARVMPAGDKHGTLVAEIFGDGSNNVVRFRMQDGEGKVWQATWASILVDWSGWKTLYLDTRTLREVDGQDPSAMMSRFPIRFQSILLDDCSASDALPGVESGRKGEVYLGRLFFAEEG